MGLTIEFDQASSYSPGQVVSGRVVLVNSFEDVFAKSQGLEIRFEGKAMARFMKRLYGKGRWKRHVASEIYFDQTSYLVGNGTRTIEELSKPGKQEYPFSFRLPQMLPSSYKGSHGCVEYTVSALSKRTWSFDKFAVAPFEVAGVLDLNNIHDARQPAILRKQKRLGYLAWKSKPIEVTLRLKTKGYVPGDFLQFALEVNNKSDNKLNMINVFLTQECRYLAEGSSNTVTNVIKKLKGPQVPARENTTWEDNLLRVPPLPPTNLSCCGIIEMKYYLNVIVQPSPLSIRGRAIIGKLPIIIGTIPPRLHQPQLEFFQPSAPPILNYMQLRMNLSNLHTPQPHPTAPFYFDFDYYPIPNEDPPSYEEALRNQRYVSKII